MSHTPGPWRRGIGNDANRVFDSQGRVVAERTGYDDGHLIAAAPDMLEALQAILAMGGLFDLMDAHDIAAPAVKKAMQP